MTSDGISQDGSPREDASPEDSPLRTRFLAAGMRVLGRDGYKGFKQAAVCEETGLTTGAFYHSFRNWKEFEGELIEHWRIETTDRLIEWLDEEVDVDDRIEALIQVAIHLPHRSEAAIRVWAAGDERIHEALAQVDEIRRETIARHFRGIGVDDDHAQQFAALCMLLLAGHEAAGTSLEQYEWSLRHCVDTDPKIQEAMARRAAAKADAAGSTA
ncbi:MAG: TetR/AcrR family transcriptional regulator [Gordonia sp. (in: high G+C Gram-positive bacteria)]|uniref:TetR/AcrR family transcriptional regulator n=1 Tax=Gordonia sp. (in: high G+C Gram-positive bacteria) TaxID=84139 RepID=UPI0039E57512